ncbi:aminotransferase, partial [Candidatus Parcubacteria bacterium]
GIGEGDEVVLPGATCSVMANAVLRARARPVYADIDPETLGSEAGAIERVLSPRTRMIVAQHSFGIPCDIEPIVELADAHGIFLLEDCALTLGSSIHGKVAGNFGQAALFSTDHSKPLNTMTGGLVYSRNRKLIQRLRRRREETDDIPIAKQQALYQRMLLEREYCHPARYGRLALREIIERFSRPAASPFLGEDFGVRESRSYPYPAKLPGFLALLGLFELARWERVASERKKVLEVLVRKAESLGASRLFPAAYRDDNREIVPLRLGWHADNGAHQRRMLSGMVDVSWTWFMRPIIATREPLERFGYRWGSCPESERIGPLMVNLPCNVPAAWAGELAECLSSALELREKA